MLGNITKHKLMDLITDTKEVERKLNQDQYLKLCVFTDSKIVIEMYKTKTYYFVNVNIIYTKSIGMNINGIDMNIIYVITWHIRHNRNNNAFTSNTNILCVDQSLSIRNARLAYKI